MSAWPKKKLGDIVDFFSGYAWRSARFSDDSSGVPIIRIQNVDAVRRSDFAYWLDDYDPRFLIDEGDILLTLSGSFRVEVWQGPQALLNQRIVKITPKAQIDRNWLLHSLRGALAEIEAMGRHALVNNVALSDLRDMELACPPLDEQKRIAAILDQADELRRKRQRALDRLNQLGQAIFVEMFGDPKTNPKGLPWATLGEVANFYSGNSLPEGEPFSGRDDGHLLLKVSDLNHPLNQHDIICAASWSAAPGSRAGTCPQDALIFPKRGGAIGTNKKRWLRRSAILDPNLMGVHPDQSRLTMSFLLAWFETFNLSDIASGSSVPQLNKQDLAPLQLALPPLGEQIAFAERMDEITSMRGNLANAHSCDNRLFDVLQHYAFRGELTTSSLKEVAA